MIAAVSPGDSGRQNGDIARIKVQSGATTEWLLAEWAAGAWQSGVRRFDPSTVTDVEIVQVRS